MNLTDHQIAKRYELTLAKLFGGTSHATSFLGYFLRMDSKVYDRQKYLYKTGSNNYEAAFYHMMFLHFGQESIKSTPLNELRRSLSARFASQCTVIKFGSIVYQSPWEIRKFLLEAEKEIITRKKAMSLKETELYGQRKRILHDMS